MPSDRLLRAAQQRKEARGRRGLKREAPAISDPRQLQRRYAAALRRYVDDIADRIRKEIIDRLPDILRQRDASAPRTDSWDDDVEQAVNAVRVYGERRASDVVDTLPTRANGVIGWNSRQFRRAMRATLGVDITGDEALGSEFIRTASRSWVRENATLISSVRDELLDDVAGIVYRDVRAGKGSRETSKAIRKRFGVSRNRANLIARTETAKLNADITQARNEALGIEMYEWQTGQDERVRESHRAMNGMLCRWDDPTVYSDDGGETWKSRTSIGGVELHPGEDFQCRCGSAPYLEDILAEL